jgi:hypothetical protein
MLYTILSPGAYKMSNDNPFYLDYCVCNYEDPLGELYNLTNGDAVTPQVKKILKRINKNLVFLKADFEKLGRIYEAGKNED